MEREIKTYVIHGTVFEVNVMDATLRQQDNPNNIIELAEMLDMGTHYEGLFDLKKKAQDAYFPAPSAHAVEITIPQLTTLDPEGMARRLELPVSELTGKSDWEAIQSSPAYRQRVEMGKQPVLVIEGHPFFVSVFSGTIQPKDDFRTTGIPIADLDDYDGPYGKAIIPYDPQNHRLKEVDFDELYELPRDWKMVEIPPVHELDPYGWARQAGWDIKEILLSSPMRAGTVARTVPWSETPVPEMIESNRKRLLGRNQNQDHKPAQKSKGQRRK